MPKVKSSTGKRRPGRPSKVSVGQETSNDDSSPVLEQETRSSKKQKTIHKDLSPISKPTTRSKNKLLMNVPQDTDTEEQEIPEAQTPLTKHAPQPSTRITEEPPSSETPPTKAPKPTTTVTDQQPKSQTPPTSPKPKTAPKPTATVTEQPAKSQSPTVTEQPAKSQSPTVTEQPAKSQISPTSDKREKASKPTTTDTEQPPEPENPQTSDKPPKAPEPTITVTEQPPQSENPTTSHKPPKAPSHNQPTSHKQHKPLKPTTSRTITLVGENPNNVSYVMNEHKGKFIAHLVPNVLSQLDSSITPNRMSLKTKFNGPRTLDWDTLEKLNLHTQFSVWITPVWKRFFDLKRPVYKTLIFEFFTTFKFNKNATKDTFAMAFYLCGKKYKLTLKDFGVAMNLFTREEFEGSAIGLGFWNLPNDANLSEFWSTFGVGEYDKNMSCTSIIKPAYRILHRLISESINQRGSCTNLVTQDDMFYMFCIVNNRPCNIARCLARYLYKSVGKSENSAVCGGAYVTQLAIGLNAITVEELDKLEVLAVTGVFDILHLRKLDIVERNAPFRLVDPSNNAAKDAKEKDTTDAASRLNAIEGEVRDIKGQLQWVSDGLHFLIQKLGHSFEPPPHMKDPVEATDENTPASPHTSNIAGSSSNPSSS